MFTTRLKTIATTAIALAALVALSACGKKVDDTLTVPVPAPIAAPMTPASGMK